MPDLRFEVTVNTRSTVVVSGAGELGHGAPRREDLTISVLVRTAEDLAIEKRDRVEAALSDALELDRANGDSLAFSVGLASAPATTVQRSARPGTVAPRMEDLAAPNPWGWLYSRWTLMALVLMGLAALVLRPRRQLDDQEAASFAELLRSSIAEREIADAK